ncbi:unnamed protein product [Mytilus coruscus]|uniref:Chromo domain-containing protein n=1 Tax=Mytilus coruscus TaxID=42192 RepID=A0A6J8BK17_MYTCO|nr:unnamed protein product [Mytilus coruscus]
MKIPFDIALEPKDSLPQDTRVYIDQFLFNIKMSHKIALQNAAAQKEKDKVRHDQTAKVRTFAIGDLVLLEVHKFLKGQSRKLCDKASGPYRIKEICPNYTYCIRGISDHKKQASLVNATNLQPYMRPDPTRSRNPEVDQDDEATPNVEVEATQQPIPIPQQPPDPATRYQIQKVLRGRRKHGRREMYIKWLDGSCTWEPDTCFDEEIIIASVDEAVRVVQKKIFSYFESKPDSSASRSEGRGSDDHNSTKFNIKCNRDDPTPTDSSTPSSSNHPPCPDIGNNSIECLQQDRVKLDLLTKTLWEKCESIDVTTYEVQNDSDLKELSEPSGGPWGGTYVDLEYEIFLRDLFGKDVWKTYIKEFPEDILEIKRKFEAKKRGIKKSQKIKTTIPYPASLFRTYTDIRKSDSIQEDLKKSVHGKTVTVSNEKLRYEPKIIKQFFEKSIESIISHVRNRLATSKR